jgi:hypothetical protein
MDQVQRRTLPGGTPLVLVPTVCPNLISSRGRVTEETVRAVAAALNECAGPVIVAGHYPLLVHTPQYDLTHERRLRNAEALRKALGESSRRILYVCGHVHRFSYLRDQQFPSLEHLSTGAFFHQSRYTGCDGEFARIDVLDTGFRVVRHTHAPASGWTAQTEAPG